MIDYATGKEPRCPRCDQRIEVSPTGLISPHRDLCGAPCWATRKTMEQVERQIELEKRKLGIRT